MYHLSNKKAKVHYLHNHPIRPNKTASLIINLINQHNQINLLLAFLLLNHPNYYSNMQSQIDARYPIKMNSP